MDSIKNLKADVLHGENHPVFEDINLVKSSNNRCLICNTVVNVNAKSKFNFTDAESDDDEENRRYIIYKKKRRLKNCVSLFCKLVNVNFEESFGPLFTSILTRNNTKNVNLKDEILTNSSIPCCSRCYDLLLNVWKLQDIIKQTQDLQQKDVKSLNKLFLESPLYTHLTTQVTRLTGPENPTPPSKTSVNTVNANQQNKKKTTATSLKKCSVILTRCDHLIPPSKAKGPSPHSSITNYSKRSSRKSKLNCLKLIKTLASPKKTVETTPDDDTEPELDTEDFPENFSYGDELEYLHDPLELSPDEVINTPKDFHNENIDSPLLNSKITRDQWCTRDANFSKQEVHLLSKLAYENKDVLYPKLYSGKTVCNKQKKAVWEKITTAINLACCRGRSAQQLRKKFFSTPGLRIDTENSKGLASLGESQSETLEDSMKISSCDKGGQQLPGNLHIKGLARNTIRAANFSPKEISVLTKLVRENVNILSAKINSITGVTQEQKDRIWEKITQALDEECETNRSVGQIRKKASQQRIIAKVLSNYEPHQSHSSVYQTELLDGEENVNDDNNFDNPTDIKPDINSIVTRNKEQICEKYLLKRRQENFSDDETQLVIKLFQENRKILLMKTNLCDSVVQRRKSRVWRKITNSVNKFSGKNRSVVQIQKKIARLRISLKSPSNINLDKSTEDNTGSDDEESADGAENMQKRMTPRRRGPGKGKGTTQFSYVELKLLLKLANEKSDVLCPKEDSSSTVVDFTKHRQEVWTEITNTMNAATGQNRSVEQVRRKFAALTCASREKDKRLQKVNSIEGNKTMQLEDNESDGDGSLEDDCETMSPVTKKVPAAIVAKRLQIQRRRWRNRSRTQCKQCNRTFKNVYGLRAHEVSHIPKSLRQKFICSQCGDQFLNESSVKVHMVRIHKEDPGKCHVCPVCNLKFYPFDGYRFRLHVKRHNDGKPRPEPVKCDICGQEFWNKKRLKKHANVHSTERRYQCEFCPESFSYATKLNRHLRCYHKEVVLDPKFKPVIPFEYRSDFIGPKIAYPCEFCEKVYPLRSTINQHLLLCKVKKKMESQCKN